MKIGIILHPYGEKQPGGLPRMIYQWTKALLEVDGKNEYVIFLKHTPEASPKLPGKNWYYEVLGGGPLWLDRLKHKTKADVYLFNTPVLPLFHKVKRSVVIALDFPYKYFPPHSLKERIHNFFLGAYHSFSLKRADMVLAISKAAEEDVIKLFRVPEEKIAYVPQGYINICAVPETTVPLPEKFFLFVGTLKERKNVLRIIEAYNAFQKKHPDTGHMLVIAGKKETLYYGVLDAYVKKEGLGGKVMFLGHRNDGELSYIYRRAEAVLFPSIVEATGNPIIEGMHCGVPVITSNIAGPAELGGEGSALLVDPFKTEEIERAMEQIVFEKGLRDELIRKGKERVKKYEWPEAARNLLTVLEKTALK